MGEQVAAGFKKKCAGKSAQDCTLKNSHRDLKKTSLNRHQKIQDKESRGKPRMLCGITLYAVTGEKRSSRKEHRADALALRAEERRDKLRKAAGRGRYPLIRRYLNGETRTEGLRASMHESIVHGREPGELKHLSSRRKRKKHRFRK